LRLKTILLTGFGFFFLVLGAAGLIIPVWPTTPFVLLAAACFSSAPRIKARIMSIPFFREHIVNYGQRTGLSRKTVLISLVWLWGMLLLSMALTHKARTLCILPIIGLTVTCHILLMAKGRNKGTEE